MKILVIILVIMLLWTVDGKEEDTEVEPRGKGLKLALVTNLAIVLAAKIGLYKIILSVALLAASIKMFIILAWAIKIYKHVPDPYLHYKHSHHDDYDNFDKFGPNAYDPYRDKFDHQKIKSGYEIADFIADFFTNHH